MIGLASCSQSRRFKAHLITERERRGNGDAAERIRKSISRRYERSLDADFAKAWLCFSMEVCALWSRAVRRTKMNV